MIVSVAICTWNRARLLDQTLAEMGKVQIPTGVEWELLVVNNNCTDETDSVIERHSGELPIRRLFEPRLGLSRARNRAVEAARGELILWTDDDVLVDEGWLAAYVRAAARWPDAAFFGGVIDPWYEVTPPRWVEQNLGLLNGMLVIRNLSDEEQPFREGWSPYGANMAFRRRVLERCPFDPRFGSTGGDIVLGDETNLIHNLVARGMTGVWVPAAKVKHYVAARRLTRAFLWKHFFGFGRADVRLQEEVPGKTILGVPRWMYRIYIELYVKLLKCRVTSDRDWVRVYMDFAKMGGMIYESRMRSRSSRPAAHQAG
jgi:glycosyltransferase involved in cell wall biosynthesis